MPRRPRARDSLTNASTGPWRGAAAMALLCDAPMSRFARTVSRGCSSASCVRPAAQPASNSLTSTILRRRVLRARVRSLHVRGPQCEGKCELVGREIKSSQVKSFFVFCIARPKSVASPSVVLMPTQRGLDLRCIRIVGPSLTPRRASQPHNHGSDGWRVRHSTAQHAAARTRRRPVLARLVYRRFAPREAIPTPMRLMHT
jgi:hypothetical protein